MSALYQEVPFIFLTSTDAAIPQGRNVRVLQRSRNAAAAEAVQKGEFISFRAQVKESKTPTVRRSRKVLNQASNRVRPQSSPITGRKHDVQLRLYRRPSLAPGMKTSLDFTQLGLDHVLALAAHHIRRMATIDIRSSTTQVLDRLRRRQWSYVSLLRIEGHNKPACLNGALICVAAKLRQIVFGDVSPLYVLSQYDRALQSMRQAVQSHMPTDDDGAILTTMQLLAIFEMLESSDNIGWQKHVKGAQSMMQMQLSNPVRINKCQLRPFLQTAPMFIDALFENNREYFEKSPWRVLIRAVVCEYLPAGQLAETVIDCLSNIPDLLAESNDRAGTMPLEEGMNLMSRAYALKQRLQLALYDIEPRLSEDDRKSPHFDVLGLSLLGLIALDRIISSAMPTQYETGMIHSEATDEVCLRLLELELRRLEMCGMHIVSAVQNVKRPIEGRVLSR